MEYANYILESCELCSTIGIKVLIQKSLVKIDNDNKLRMHNLLQDMGREIVRKESPDEPGKRSRLWSHEEALHVLKECTGTRNVKGLLLKFDQGGEETVLEEHHFDAKAFAALSNLRLLDLDDAHLVGDFKHLLSKLRWLKWKCPLKLLPTNFYPKKLTILDLSQSMINRFSDMWHQNQFPNLKVLNLSWCQFLARTRHFLGLPDLQSLILKCCKELIEVHESIGNLRKLVLLDLSQCENVVELPSSIWKLGSLQNLWLSHCSKLTKLPEQLSYVVSSIDLASGTNIVKIPNSIGLVRNLTNLSLCGTSIIGLPSAIGLLGNLVKLDVSRCSDLVNLPDSMEKMKSLKFLDMRSTGVVKLPEDFGKLSSLKVLNMAKCQELESVPENFGNLVELWDLDIQGSGIVKLSEDFGQLSSLMFLKMKFCQNLKRLPENFGNLVHLMFLDIEGSGIVKLPEDFGQLSGLFDLNMKFCQNLKSLPQNFGNLVNLYNLDMEGSGIVKLPNDFGKLSNLRELDINGCQNLKIFPENFWNLVHLDTFHMNNTGIVKLPEVVESLPENFDDLAQLRVLYASNVSEGVIPSDIEKLSSLESWLLSGHKFYSLPASIGELSKLQSLYLRNCTNLQVLPKLPSSLIGVDATNCISLERIIDLSNLNNLRLLYLDNCTKLQALPDLPSSLENLGVTNCQRFPDVSKLKILWSLSFSNSSKLQSLPECVGSVQSDAANCMSNSLSPIQVISILTRKFLFNTTKNIPECFIPAQCSLYDDDDGEIVKRVINLRSKIPAATAEVAQPRELNLDIEIIGLVLYVVFSVKGLQTDPHFSSQSVISVKGFQTDPMFSGQSVHVYRNDRIYECLPYRGCNIMEEEHDQIYLCFCSSALMHHLKGGDDILAKVKLGICYPKKLDMKKGGFYFVYNSNEDSTTLLKTTYERVAAEFSTSSCGASVGGETSANKELVNRNAIDFSFSSFNDEGELDRLCIDGSNANGPDKDEQDQRLTSSTLHSSNAASSNIFFNTDDDWGLHPQNQKKPKKNPPLHLNEEEDVHLPLSLNNPKADGPKKDELDLSLSLNHSEADNDRGPLPPNPKKPKKNPPLDLNEEEDVHLSLSLNHHPEADEPNKDELDISLSQPNLDSLNAFFSGMSFVSDDFNQKKRKKGLDADDDGNVVLPKPKKPKKISCLT